MPDNFRKYAIGLESPANKHYDIATYKNDTTDLPEVCRGYHISSGTTIVFVNRENVTVTLTVIAGHRYGDIIKRIKSTGTNVTGYALA